MENNIAMSELLFPKLKAALSTMFLENNVICAAIIGSHAERLATSTSDIDVLAIFEDGRDQFYRQVQIDIFVFVDVWFCSIHEYRRLLETSTAVDYFRIPQRQLELIHKAARGLPFFGEDFYQLESSRSLDYGNFSERLVELSMYKVAASFSDLIGVVRSKNFFGCIDFARQYLRYLMDATLARSGDTYLKDKWRMMRCARLEGELASIVSAYLELELHAPREEDLLIWIDQVFKVGGLIQLWLYRDLSSDGEVEAIQRKLFPENSLRSSAICIAQRRGMFLMHTPAGTFKISAAGALALLNLKLMGTLDMEIALRGVSLANQGSLNPPNPAVRQLAKLFATGQIILAGSA